ncbi:hypothetical protein Tsubulata_033654 [Turnera subulata]|uniref:Initiator tRNA phosphoribosyl transferase family protein n=1 Tax=Turnera subulata TaxID=218843 RepID=A0A9Q0JIG2_9ROSI|nr:hypothetical protein Tsubulata_033654 [Turnera subulata]
MVKNMDMEDGDGKISIYRAARTIKRRENSLYNALRSIYEDSIFVGEISQLWPDLPLLANLRCGLWYSPAFHSTCYFKSTDGHTNNWSFNTARLNLHVALLAGQKGGCMVVDSTRKGKRFPDSMSKTIPIWTCVLNRAVANHIKNMPEVQEELIKDTKLADPDNWDCELHLPNWVSIKEKAEIEERLEEWTKQLESSGADIASIAFSLKKPLRPLWISQRSVIWLNEVPHQSSWDFTPIILVSASASDGVFQHRTTSEFSWRYIAGAGDDEESWARGLSPSHFWKHAYDIISSGPDVCNQKVADIVEKDRVYRAQRGQTAPQITVKPPKISDSGIDNPSYMESSLAFNMSNNDATLNSADVDDKVFWLGTTNLAVGPSQAATHASNVNCILNCDQVSIPICFPDAEAYFHLPVVSSKLDRFSVLNNLPAAVNFARVNLQKGNRLLVCCRDGEDISVCVCLAILTSLFNDEGTFDDGKLFSESHITKWEMRRRLVFICKFAITARPSRGNLKQVFGFLSGGRVGSA